MKCVVCKSSDIFERDVEEEIKVNNDIALYPVKVKVCDNCGERYYDRKTMQLLEGVKDKLKQKKLKLKVVGKVLRVSTA